MCYIQVSAWMLKGAMVQQSEVHGWDVILTLTSSGSLGHLTSLGPSEVGTITCFRQRALLEAGLI